MIIGLYGVGRRTKLKITHAFPWAYVIENRQKTHRHANVAAMIRDSGNRQTNAVTTCALS